MYLNRSKHIFFPWGWTGKTLACTLYLQEGTVLYLTLQRERIQYREGAWEGMRCREGAQCREGTVQGEYSLAGLPQWDRPCFTYLPSRCRPRTKLSLQVAWLHSCRSKCVIYGTALCSLASFLIPIAIEIYQQKHKQIKWCGKKGHLNLKLKRLYKQIEQLWKAGFSVNFH